MCFQILLGVSLLLLLTFTISLAEAWISVSAEAMGWLGVLCVLMLGAAATKISGHLRSHESPGRGQHPGGEVAKAQGEEKGPKASID
jgi:hypothetical protein